MDPEKLVQSFEAVSNDVYPHRCAIVGEVPYIFIRSKDMRKLAADDVRRIADKARAEVSRYTNGSIQFSGQYYPLNVKTGEMMPLDKPLDEDVEVIYERRFKINPGLF